MNEDLLNNGEALSNCNSLSPGGKKKGVGDINEHCPLYFGEADEYVSAAVRPLRVEVEVEVVEGEWRLVGLSQVKSWLEVLNHANYAIRKKNKTNANFLLTLQSEAGGCAAALIKGLITDGDS